MRSILFLAAGFIIGLAIGLYVGNFFNLPFANSPLDFANWGGFFGGFIGTCIAGLAAYFGYTLNRKQSKMMERQSFEAPYLQMINLMIGNMQSLRSNIYHTTLGRNLFIEYSKYMFEKVDKYYDQTNIELINYINEHSSELGWFIDCCSQILEYVECSTLESKDKDRFVRILFSMLAEGEKEVLYLSGLYKEDIKLVLNKYSINLRNIKIKERVDALCY